MLASRDCGSYPVSGSLHTWSWMGVPMNRRSCPRAGSRQPAARAMISLFTLRYCTCGWAASSWCGLWMHILPPATQGGCLSVHTGAPHRCQLMLGPNHTCGGKCQRLVLACKFADDQQSWCHGICSDGRLLSDVAAVHQFRTSSLWQHLEDGAGRLGPASVDPL